MYLLKLKRIKIVYFSCYALIVLTSFFTANYLVTEFISSEDLKKNIENKRKFNEEISAEIKGFLSQYKKLFSGTSKSQYSKKLDRFYFDMIEKLKIGPNTLCIKSKVDNNIYNRFGVKNYEKKNSLKKKNLVKYSAAINSDESIHVNFLQEDVDSLFIPKESTIKGRYFLFYVVNSIVLFLIFLVFLYANRKEYNYLISNFNKSKETAQARLLEIEKLSALLYKNNFFSKANDKILYQRKRHIEKIALGLKVLGDYLSLNAEDKKMKELVGNMFEAANSPLGSEFVDEKIVVSLKESVEDSLFLLKNDLNKKQIRYSISIPEIGIAIPQTILNILFFNIIGKIISCLSDQGYFSIEAVNKYNSIYFSIKNTSFDIPQNINFIHKKFSNNIMQNLSENELVKMLRFYHYSLIYDESNPQDIKFELSRNLEINAADKKYKASIIEFKKKEQ